MVYASATTRRHVGDVLAGRALKVNGARTRRIPTPELNRVIRNAVESNPPPIRKGKQFKVLYATQGKERTPTIVLFVNDPDLAHFSYRRYLENQVREKYDFAGVPLRCCRRRGKEDSR